jgi:hypothetical protein
MAGLRMSTQEICKVIGAGRNGVRGSDSGKPIAKTTLFRHFRNELASGRAMLKARVAGKFYDALNNNEPWAIQMAMRNQFGWDAGRGGFQLDAGALTDQQPETTVHVTFVVPGKKPWHDTFAGPVAGQKLLPSPPAMRQNELGFLEPEPEP